MRVVLLLGVIGVYEILDSLDVALVIEVAFHLSCRNFTYVVYYEFGDVVDFQSMEVAHFS